MRLESYASVGSRLTYWDSFDTNFACLIWSSNFMSDFNYIVIKSKDSCYSSVIHPHFSGNTLIFLIKQIFYKVVIRLFCLVLFGWCLAKLDLANSRKSFAIQVRAIIASFVGTTISYLRRQN
jgi:hypothetical protein